VSGLRWDEIGHELPTDDPDFARSRQSRVMERATPTGVETGTSANQITPAGLDGHEVTVAVLLSPTHYWNNAQRLSCGRCGSTCWTG
jgi:hypothetical protein